MATIKKRNGSYKITVSCGYDINDKQIRKNMTWTPAAGMTARQEKKELERQTVLFEEKCRTGQVLNGSIRFADFTERWLEDYAIPQLRPTTVAGYRQFLKRIIPAIGHIRLDKLQPHHLQEFYKNLAETDIRTDSKYRFRGNFSAWLHSLDLTQEKLSQLCNVSLSTLGQISAGKNVSKQTAMKIASACCVPVSDLFDTMHVNATLSAVSIRHYHQLISSILSTAVQWQVIFSNPCDRIKPPKAPHKEAMFLDDKQAAHLLELLAELPKEQLDFRTAVTMLLFTGMRRSELLGLNWSDVDLNTGVISVNHTSKYLPKVGMIEDDTKTTSSRRSFKAPAELLPLLREYQEWQENRKEMVGDQWHDSDRIFTSWNGTPMRPDTLTNRFRRWIRTTDLPNVHPHSLRHTNATLLIANGTNIQTVSKRLGHSTSSTTSNIYAHAIQSADAAAAEAVPIFKVSLQKSKDTSV